jgi:hypothetical protein
LNEAMLRMLKRGETVVGRFTFSQKVDIAEAVGVWDEPGLFTCIREVNLIRNRLAHDLDPDDVATQLDSLSIPFRDGPADPGVKGLMRFMAVVTAIGAFPMGFCEGHDRMPDTESQISDLLLPVVEPLVRATD